jgi:gas vesicle protein GvpL/GvpF
MPRSAMTRSNRVRRALARRTLQRGQAHQVVWVYAITDGLKPDLLAGLTGVGGEKVRAVSEAGLTAVVGSVDAAEFGEQARPRLLSDLASIERLGRAHHQVIACAAADGPVLPLRLATVYPDDQTVRGLLAQSSAEFLVMLESFRGTEEWGVKVYVGLAGSDSPLDRPAVPGQPSGNPLDGPVSQPCPAPWPTGWDAGTGLAQPDPALDGDAEACAVMIDRALSGIAVATRRHPAADPRIVGNENFLVLNAAYLLNSERATEFAAVARALARVNQGVRADLTGPWPPYSFADLHQA